MYEDKIGYTSRPIMLLFTVNVMQCKIVDIKVSQIKKNTSRTLYNVNGARSKSNKNGVNKNTGYKSEFSVNV